MQASVGGCKYTNIADAMVAYGREKRGHELKGLGMASLNGVQEQSLSEDVGRLTT